MQRAGNQTSHQTGQESNKRCQPRVDAAGDQNGRNGAAGGEGAVNRQIRGIQDPESDIHSNGHDSPDQPLGSRTGQLIQQLSDVQGFPPLSGQDDYSPIGRYPSGMTTPSSAALAALYSLTTWGA